jgi:hypothetical protein
VGADQRRKTEWWRGAAWRDGILLELFRLVGRDSRDFRGDARDPLPCSMLRRRTLSVGHTMRFFVVFFEVFFVVLFITTAFGRDV